MPIEEEWRKAIGFEDYYVSNYGRIKSRAKILKTSKSIYGYERVMIGSRTNKSRTTVSVHRLVAKAFIENINKKETVNHIDGNKCNNSVTNLEWATSSENVIHAWKIGLCKGSKGHKYSEEYKRKCRIRRREFHKTKNGAAARYSQMLKLGKKITDQNGNIYNCLNEAGKKVGRTKQAVSIAIKNDREICGYKFNLI